ncbi:MAG: prepilin-type N-terminal cleavage/methylation domain-containing protein [bacterium]|nr:prepilin-type N-terminal cleavage/methylation domain-containing protein [bacterium]
MKKSIAGIRPDFVKISLGKNPKSEFGFTLLEVVIALVIVVVGLVLISQAFSIGLRAVRVSDKATIARFLAEQKITEIELQSFLALQSGTGDFGPDYPDFTWQMNVATTQLDNLLQINLTISWIEDNTTRTLTITKLIADRGEISS